MTHALGKLSTQQDADSMSIRIFLSSPWHTRACWRLEEKQRWRVLSISYWCLLCSCACHRNTAQATHFSAIPTSEKGSIWLHLPQAAWWASSTKDVAQRPHGQLYSLELPDPLWSKNFPSAGWVSVCLAHEEKCPARRGAANWKAESSSQSEDQENWYGYKGVFLWGDTSVCLIRRCDVFRPGGKETV